MMAMIEKVVRPQYYVMNSTPGIQYLTQRVDQVQILDLHISTHLKI